MNMQDLKIVFPHKKVAEPVINFKDIIEDANAMSRLLNADNFVGSQSRGYALHHSQVSENPKNFFVVHRKWKGLFGGHSIIINPKIYKRNDMKTYQEFCLSYPHRGAKGVKRAHQIICQFSVENATGTGMVTIGDINIPEVKPFILAGLAAQIFQHEFDHGHGQYIYDKK